MKRLRKDCEGFTLVELIVTFTLTAIFVASATLVLSTFMHSHTVARAVATEQSVSSIVMETISGALSSAKYDCVFEQFTADALSELTWADEEEKKNCALLIRTVDGNSEVWYADGESDSVVRMYLKPSAEDPDKKYLALDYYAEQESATPTGTDRKWESAPAHWQLGVGVYQHCTVDEFHVSPIKKENSTADSSCLSVKLKLKNGLAGDDNSFTIQRAFDCYNLAPENIVIE